MLEGDMNCGCVSHADEKQTTTSGLLLPENARLEVFDAQAHEDVLHIEKPPSSVASREMRETIHVAKRNG